MNDDSKKPSEDDIVDDNAEQATDAVDADAAVDAEEEQELSPEEAQAKALEDATAKAEENWDRYLRASAELENVRKRMERETEKARKFALEKFAAELLPVVDSLEMGIKAANEVEGDKTEHFNALEEGSEMTLRMLMGTLEKFGVKVIDTEGQRFNPELHEAMTMIPMPGAEPNSIVDVVQTGYTLYDRVIRPARVVVAKAAD